MRLVSLHAGRCNRGPLAIPSLFVDPRLVRLVSDAVPPCYVQEQVSSIVLDGVSPVRGLHIRTGPDAVFRRVASINIFALDGKMIGVTMRQRPFAKRNKVHPLCTNGDAATAVVFELRVCGSSATPLHVLPNAMKPSSALPVCPTKRSNRFPSLAPARGGLSRSKIAGGDDPFGTARASAAPKRHASHSIPRLVLDMPKTNGFPRHINETRIFCHA